ncbi:MAG: metalloregulator ArsR/SmtB family transcription factor [bacterium]
MSFVCSVKHPDCGGRCEEIPNILNFASCLQDENRLRIICVLNNTQGYTSSQIVEAVELPQNLVSHHLKALHKEGILNREKKGLFVYYKLDREAINEKVNLLSFMLYNQEVLASDVKGGS